MNLKITKAVLIDLFIKGMLLLERLKVARGILEFRETNFAYQPRLR